MCFDLDSRPPIEPISGGALDAATVTLHSADGTAFRAFRAAAAAPVGAGVLILPDARGLHPFYEELALRFAEHGVDALAIDYFGRTAGVGDRGSDFEYAPHVQETRWATLAMDIAAGAEELRAAEGGRARSLFTVGFCYGGRLSFLSSTIGLDLAGSIGFYGVPAGPGRSDIPAPVDLADRITCPILGLFGGADQAIGPDAIAAFDRALEAAGVRHELITFPNAPHSFFDRKAADFAEASADSWAATIGFIRDHTAA